MAGFTGRVVLVTGAGSGIGKQLARMLAGEGAAVAALDVASAGLEALAAEFPGAHLAWQVADVTDRNALQRAVGQLEERLGPIDVLIASAGIACETSALCDSAADVDNIVRVNLIGVSNSIGAVLPGMLTRKRGHLVGISSLASFRGLPGMAGYCASKAGLNALLDAFRVELRDRGIDVTTVCPGWIRTPMTAQVHFPMPDILEVEEAGRQILAAIRRRAALVAFPTSSAMRLRILRMLPCRLADALVFRMMRALKRG